MTLTLERIQQIIARQATFWGGSALVSFDTVEEADNVLKAAEKGLMVDQVATQFVAEIVERCAAVADKYQDEHPAYIAITIADEIRKLTPEATND